MAHNRKLGRSGTPSNLLILLNTPHLLVRLRLLQGIAPLASTFTHLQSFQRIIPSQTSFRLNMCNGESGRLSQGGTIAILRPPHNEYGRRTCDDSAIYCHLLFWNSMLAEPRTLAEIRGVDERHMDVVGKCWVMIQ